MVPGATATVDHDKFVSGERLNARTQLLEATVTGGGTNVLRQGNMRLRVKHVGTNLNHQWLFSLGLKDLDQFVGVDKSRGWDRAGLVSDHSRCRDQENYSNREGERSIRAQELHLGSPRIINSSLRVEQGRKNPRRRLPSLRVCAAL